MKTITDHPFLIGELLVRAEHRKQRRVALHDFLRTPLGITTVWLMPMLATAAFIRGGIALLHVMVRHG